MKSSILALAVSATLSLPVFASQPEPVPAARAESNWTRKTEKPQEAPVAVPVTIPVSVDPVAVDAATAAPPTGGPADDLAGNSDVLAGASAEGSEPSSAAEQADAEDWAAAPDPSAPAEDAQQELVKSELAGEGAGGFDAAPAAPAPRARGVELGPLAWNDDGTKGRIHTVVRGDTLWDVSEAYLGTPWVWPSIWNDNGGIENPHRISPGDHIWISATEMRRLSDDEAMQMLSAPPPAANEEGELEVAEEPEPEAPPSDIDGAPATLDSLPVLMSQRSSGLGETGETLRLTGRGGLGFVASEVIEGASSIIGSISKRTMLSRGDLVYVGFGRGKTKPGDQYTIFRDPVTVRDTNGGILGYHVDIVGHIVVRETDLESSVAEIADSMSEIGIGDLLMSHRTPPATVPVKYSPAGLHGRIVFLPGGRTLMGNDDYVYLNRGSVHGLEVGSELEVFEHGYMARDRSAGRGAKLRTPDLTIANLVVVEVEADTAVAYVRSALREVEVGDLVRSHSREVASN